MYRFLIIAYLFTLYSSNNVAHSNSVAHSDISNTPAYTSHSPVNDRFCVDVLHNCTQRSPSVISVDSTQTLPNNSETVDQPCVIIVSDHSPVEIHESNRNACVQSLGESSYQLGIPLQSRPILKKSGNTIQNSKDTEVNSQRQHF